MAQTQNETLAKRESGNLIAADKVEGTKVCNAQGDKLGSIENVMIDKMSGKVAYAVMSFGGFLGMGEKRHALPWSVLKYDTNQDGYVVNLDKKTLETAPTYEPGQVVDWNDRAWGKRVHEHYHANPYWM